MLANFCNCAFSLIILKMIARARLFKLIACFHRFTLSRIKLVKIHENTNNLGAWYDDTALFTAHSAVVKEEWLANKQNQSFYLLIKGNERIKKKKEGLREKENLCRSHSTMTPSISRQKLLNCFAILELLQRSTNHIISKLAFHRTKLK